MNSALELEVTLRADRDPRSAPTLASLLRVVLRNRGAEPIEIPSVQWPAKLELSAVGLAGERGSAVAHGQLILPPLTIAPRAELSLLEAPALAACTPALSRPFPAGARDSTRFHVLLHRPGWIHAFHATWPFNGN